LHEEEPFSFAWQRTVIEIFDSSTGVTILQEKRKTITINLTSLHDIRGCFSCRSAAEISRVEEFATLISCHNSLALQTQHNMLSRSTS
jgi:hypothetical protein